MDRHDPQRILGQHLGSERFNPMTSYDLLSLVASTIAVVISLYALNRQPKEEEWPKLSVSRNDCGFVICNKSRNSVYDVDFGLVDCPAFCDEIFHCAELRPGRDMRIHTPIWDDNPVHVRLDYIDRNGVTCREDFQIC